MNEKQYQQLKKKIQEAVPEIMELKFGCKVKYPTSSTQIKTISRHEKDRCYYFAEHKMPWYLENNCVVLGRDIRLAEKAFNKKDLRYNKEWLREVLRKA